MILDAKALNKEIADFNFKKHDSNKVKQTIRHGDWGTSLDISSAFHHLIIQAESQPYLAFEFQNNHYTYRTMPFGTKHLPIYFATAIEPIMQQIRMKTEIRIINYLNDILLLHQNKEHLAKITIKVMETLKYFVFQINTEKSEIETKQTVIFLGWEWNLINTTVKKRNRRSSYFSNMIYIIWEDGQKQEQRQKLQFQEASLFLNIMDHLKLKATRLRGWNTTMIMNKTAIPEINWWVTKLRANIPAKLIQIPPEKTMTTDAASSCWSQALETELEMIAVA
ncbi:MAG: hypothetical protein EZS28_045174, partial [Streblomastix strix]